MKKKFALILICILSFGIFFFTGCNETNYTKEDVENLYSSIIDEYGDDDGLLNLGIDISLVVEGGIINQDKAYIFPLVYNKYISCASGVCFGSSQRQGKTLIYSINNFEQEEINEIYNKLIRVRESIKSFVSAKYIFENSKGNLYYMETIETLNTLISDLYSLNDSFSEYYFKYFYTDFSQESVLAEGSLKDFMWYQLCSISKVSFEYELKTFKMSNPYGEIETWFANTQLIKDFIAISERAINYLKNDNLLAGVFENNKALILDILKNIQYEMSGFESEYSLFLRALNNVNIREYFTSVNQDAYKESLSNLEKSSFEIIDSFIEGRYTGFMEGLTSIINYL